MPRIFIVEDDDNIRDLVLYALKSAGFDGTGFESPKEFCRALQNQAPDLVLLDIMLPGADGLSVLKSLKSDRATSELPVIMLTAKGSEFDRVTGLDLGADDYITKPFSVLELISRVKAVLRRRGKESKATLFAVGNVLVFLDKRQVVADGQTVALTFKEFELLCYLMQNKGIVISREKIMEQVWGFDFEGESRTVDMHIKTLRQKLGNGSGIIKTVRNVGYKVGETFE